jgi:hypothetical protein
MSRLAEVRQGQGGVRRAVADGLRTLGYDTAVCKSRWEKTPTYQAGIEALFRSRRNHGRDLDFSPAPHVRPSLTVQSELWPHKLVSQVWRAPGGTRGSPAARGRDE